MDTAKLYDILRKTTGQLRKGETFEGSPQMVAYAKAGDFEAPAPGGVLEIYGISPIRACTMDRIFPSHSPSGGE